MSWFTPQRRLWIYGICTAAMPILVSVGILSSDMTKDVLLLVSAILGIGSNVLAIRNVDKSPSIEE